MTGAERFSALAREYGQAVTVHGAEGGCREGHGFLQLFMTESKDYLWQQASKLGTFEGARFRFYGEAGLGEAETDFGWLHCLGKDYQVQEIQPIYLGQEIMYWWGVLTGKDKEDDCL